MKNKIILSTILLMSVSARVKAVESNNFDNYPTGQSDVNNASVPTSINFSSEDVNLVTRNPNIVFSYFPENIKQLIADTLKVKNLNNHPALQNLYEYTKRMTNVIGKNDCVALLTELVDLLEFDYNINPDIAKTLKEYKAYVEKDYYKLVVPAETQQRSIQEPTVTELLTTNNMLLAQILETLKNSKK